MRGGAGPVGAVFDGGGMHGPHTTIQERELDEGVVADVCALNLDGVSPEKVAMAVQRRNKRADIRVAYELLLDSKKAKQRKEGGWVGVGV